MRIRSLSLLLAPLLATITLGQSAPAAPTAADQPTVGQPTADRDWPQGAGPHGNWGAGGVAPPLRFSVRADTNIAWRTPLPETGQGGIAAVGDRVFVATMAPWDPANALSAEDAKLYSHAIEKRSVAGKHVDAHCLDRKTGELLWTRRIEGEVPAIYTYPFSDATSASPVASKTHVWFTNAAGCVTCFTSAGELVWERRYTPTYDGPFNKQFEPFRVLDGDRWVFVHMEPFQPPGRDPKSEEHHGRWHHLVGLDALTGEFLWRSDDALTQYNAPTLTTVLRPEGGYHGVLMARGGPHAVPERPVGISHVKVTGEDAGTSVWRYEDPRGNHEGSLQTMAHDDRHAYWLLKDPRNVLVVIDLTTGKEVREIPLTKGVTRHWFDGEQQSYRTETGEDLDKGVFPARYSMAAFADQVMFQCYATAWGKPTIGPAYSFCHIDVTSGDVEYLEVPTDVVRDEKGAESFLWKTPRVACPLNSRGEEVTGDDRCRWDGWDWVFNGSPTRVNGHQYYTLASGVVYVLGWSAKTFDARALLAVNDVGAAGKTWTANSMSYGNGELFHRTASELICIRRPASR